MNTNAVAAVAGNTFRESARNRVLYALVGATILVSALSYVLGSVATGEDRSPAAQARCLEIVSHISLSAISVLGAVCAIFLGTNLVYQEVERRTVYTILARPIGRGEFILGKFLGLAGVVVAATAVMGLGFTLIYCAYGGAHALTWNHAVALVFTGLELVVVVAIALLFSAIAHPIEGAIFALLVTLLSHATANLNAYGAELVKPIQGVPAGAAAHVAQKALWALYVVLPNLENLNFQAEAAHGLPIEPRLLVQGGAYFVLYTTILVSLAVLGFRKKTL